MSKRDSATGAETTALVGDEKSRGTLAPLGAFEQVRVENVGSGAFRERELSGSCALGELGLCANDGYRVVKMAPQVASQTLE